MHWGSPENLSDVTHPFLHFSLSSPGSPGVVHYSWFPHGFQLFMTAIGNHSVNMTQDSV